MQDTTAKVTLKKKYNHVNLKYNSTINGMGELLKDVAREVRKRNTQSIEHT